MMRKALNGVQQMYGWNHSGDMQSYFGSLDWSISGLLMLGVAEISTGWYLYDNQ